MSKEAMQKMADDIKKILPSDLGFALIVFPFKDVGVGNYISNACREDMIEALRETADRLEKNQDFKTDKDNIYGTE